MPKRTLSKLADIALKNMQALMARTDHAGNLIAELHMRAICADGYPGGGEGGDGELTSVEAATNARAKVVYDYAELERVLTQLVDLSGRAFNLSSRYPGVGHDHAADVKRARCDGEMDPTCSDLVVAKGKCMNCYQRARRKASA